MKPKILTLAAMLFALQAKASVTQKNLICASSAESIKISGTVNLVDGHFSELADTEIQIGYASAQLNCNSGSQISDIGCVGFWFDSKEDVVEVSFREVSGAPVAKVESLKGDYHVNIDNWPCTIE